MSNDQHDRYTLNKRVCSMGTKIRKRPHHHKQDEFSAMGKVSPCVHGFGHFCFNETNLV